jgi:hypothetical protein
MRSDAMGSPFEEPIPTGDGPLIGAQPPSREELQDAALADLRRGIDAMRDSASFKEPLDALSVRIDQLEREAHV